VPDLAANDGAVLHYEEAGSGQVVLLLGGWCMTTRFFDKQLQALSEDFRVIAMDMRAYGASAKVSHGHRMARHARDVYDLLGALDVQDAVVAGWSSGANTMLSYYELFGSERISKLVHIDQTPFCLNTDDWDLGFGTREQADAFLAGFSADPAGAAAGLVDAMFAEPVTAAEKEWMVAEMVKTPVRSALQFERDHISADWRDVVPTVQVPVLVATGRRSAIFPWKSGEWMAQHLPHGEHQVFEDSGHLPFYEEPELFHQRLRAFIGADGARAATE
jgi:pimeloyl-ACP methyl ester carboxylesterase